MPRSGLPLLAADPTPGLFVTPQPWRSFQSLAQITSLSLFNNTKCQTQQRASETPPAPSLPAGRPPPSQCSPELGTAFPSSGRLLLASECLAFPQTSDLPANTNYVPDRPSDNARAFSYRERASPPFTRDYERPVCVSGGGRANCSSLEGQVIDYFHLL